MSRAMFTTGPLSLWILISIATARSAECGLHASSVTSLDLSYETGRNVFSQWPPLVSIYVDSAVKFYKNKWSLPEVMTTMGLTNETLVDLKELRSNATLGLLQFASYGPAEAYSLAHGVLRRNLCHHHHFTSFLSEIQDFVSPSTYHLVSFVAAW